MICEEAGLAAPYKISEDIRRGAEKETGKLRAAE